MTGGVLVVDFGAQYSQLIARRVREARVWSEIVPYDISIDEVIRREPEGIIFSGGPDSVYSDIAPGVDERIYSLGVPVLGICYGAQLMAASLGGRVEKTGRREYGRTLLAGAGGGDGGGDGGAAGGLAGVFAGWLAAVRATSGAAAGKAVEEAAGGGQAGTVALGAAEVWMSHSDSIVEAPPGFAVLATSQGSPVAAFGDTTRRLLGVQFHPEVSHTSGGQALIERFLFDVCGCFPSWTHVSIIERSVEEIRAKVGDATALCGLSGGVDSAVAAAIVRKAIGSRLTCVFVDTGLLRQGEGDEVRQAFGGLLGDSLVCVDASGEFFAALKGLTDPEKKRQAVGECFIRVFEKAAHEIGNPHFLVQGTLYPDVIESGGGRSGQAAVIKSHHNVGGLPEDLAFELVEPLRMLFKDEVRAVGDELGLPEGIVWRQPFPGPGLAVRVVGEVTQQRVEILRAADAIVGEEIRKAGLYRELWQSFAVLPAVRSVGVMGDQRTYAYPIVIRAVTSDDAMTADWARLPYDIVETISARIIGEVEGVNRVVLDVTSKPPGTIEWE